MLKNILSMPSGGTLGGGKRRFLMGWSDVGSLSVDIVALQAILVLFGVSHSKGRSGILLNFDLSRRRVDRYGRNFFMPWPW